MDTGLRQRGSRWQARVFVREDKATGKQVTKAKTFRTKTEAKAWIDEHKKDIRRGTYVAPSNATVSEFAADWLEGPARTRLRSRSLLQYEQKLRTHVLPRIGSLPLSRLTLGVIDKLYSTLSDEGCSARTIQYTHAVLNSMLTSAVRGGLIVANPCAYATRPKVEEKEADYMTPQEMNDFLLAAKDDPWLCYWLTLAETGARPAEILGLRWCDVKGSKVKITRTAVRVGGEWTYTPPKTKKSKRTVSVPAETVDALRKRKLEAQASARARSEVWNDETPIFLGERGVLPDYRSLVRDHFNPHLKSAGLRRLTPKAMRHGHVSALLDRGMSMIAVAKRAGHSSTAMIDRVYGHSGRVEDERAADEIAAARRGSMRIA